NTLGLKSPHQRSSGPKPANGSRSNSCIMRNGSAIRSRDDSGHAVGELPAVVASAVEDEDSARFSSGVFRKNLKGFHLLRSNFMSCSFSQGYRLPRIAQCDWLSHAPPTE